MKFKTFESLLNNCKDLYDAGCARDKRLQDALGGDSQVMTDWWDLFISETISTISKDMGDEHEVVDWLFWESMCNNDGYVSFWEDDVEYLGSPQNVWLDLKGKLDERYSKPIYTRGEELVQNKDFNTDSGWSKEDMVNAHDTKKMDYNFIDELEKIMLPVITLKTSGIQVSREFFDEVTDRFEIDLHKIEKYKSYSLVDERGIFYTMTTTKGIIDIQKNANVEFTVKDEPKKSPEVNIKEVDMTHLADGIDPWAVIPSHKDVPIPNKDFKDNKEFYDYIKYLFECSGITVIEVATPLPSEENRFKYELKTRKFESMDFYNEIKDLIHEESIFTIYLYSASFIEMEGTKTNYNVRLDWSNK